MKGLETEPYEKLLKVMVTLENKKLKSMFKYLKGCHTQERAKIYLWLLKAGQEPMN